MLNMLVIIITYSHLSLMIIVSGTKLHFHGVNARLALCLYSVLNVKVLLGAFIQEKALVEAFSVIVM